MQARIEFAQCVRNGVLLHGPLLAFAKASGDELISFKAMRSGAERPENTMPLREGIPLQQYPFMQHAETALKIAKNFLQEIGFWTWPEEPVNRVNPDNWASSKKEENVFVRSKALHGAQHPNRVPKDTKLTVFHGSIPTFI